MDGDAVHGTHTAGGGIGGSATLGQRIQSFRKRAQLSQQQLSVRTGMSTRALRDIERDRVHRPQLRTVQRLIAALDVSDSEAEELHAAAQEAAPRSAAGKPRFLILGPLAIQRGDSSVPVTRPMLRRLLGLLVLKCPAPASYEEIVDALWPTDPPGSYQSLIHTYVSQVRRLLEPGGRPQPTGAFDVERVPSGYRLNAEPSQTDIGRFDELVSRARRAQGAGQDLLAFESLTAALQCWRGPILADVDSILRQHPLAVANSGRRIEAALLHADLALELRRSEESLGGLWDLAHDEPLHEGVHARLILALAGSGEQAAALNVFAAFRARLDEQLGIAPSEEVHHAHMRVLQQQIPQAARGAPAPAAPAPRTVGTPAQLPADTPAYVGRDAQLAELDRLLDPEGGGQAPVVTVVGPPGVGKTAFGLRWAHRQQSRFPDGQLFVNLQGHSALPALSPEDVLARFLRALGVAPEQVPADRDEQAAMYRTLLADRSMLVFLDNAADVDQVRPLLPGNGGCRVVITSRSKLVGLVATHGARHIGLDVLSPAAAHTLLERLLADDRADAEHEAIAELARLCGRLPLALRIAAANLVAGPATPVADYCARLRGGNLLSALQVEGDEHATVRAAFDLSYHALPEPARRMFRLLSVLPGPDVTAQGAAALLDTPVAAADRLLRRLAHAHLVQEPAPGRFAAFDLLHTYARELADEEETAAPRGRLLEWYLRNAEAADRSLARQSRGPAGADPGDPRAARADRGDAEPGDAEPGDAGPGDAEPGGGRQALEWLETERQSLVGAVRTAADAGLHRVARRLAEALHGFLTLRVYAADRLAVATLGLAAATADGDLRGRSAAQLRCAECYWTQGDNVRANELFAQALALAREADWLGGQAMALREMGAAHQEHGAMRQASSLLSQASSLTEQDGGTAAPDDLTSLGLICWKLGRLPEAAEHHAHAARLFAEAGFPDREAVSRTNLGIAYRALGRPREVIQLLGETHRVHERNGNRISATVALSCLSSAHSDVGDHASGLAVAKVSLASAQAMGDKRLEANALFSMGAAHEAAGHLADAVARYEQAIALAESVDDRYPQVYALVGLAAVLLRLDRLEEAATAAEQALATARRAEFRMLEGNALNVLAALRLRAGQAEPALGHAREALALHRETGHRPGTAKSHLALGGGHAALGHDALARAHWRTAVTLLREMGMPLPGGLRLRPAG